MCISEFTYSTFNYESIDYWYKIITTHINYLWDEKLIREHPQPQRRGKNKSTGIRLAVLTSTFTIYIYSWDFHILSQYIKAY